MASALPCGARNPTCADHLLAHSRLPRAEARLLLERASGQRREWLLAHGERPLGTSVCEYFLSLNARREKGEPIAYLLGEREFHGHTFHVDARVLIPRPETELLVDEAIARAPKGARIIDLGTGSGAIAISLALARPDLMIVASDASDDALALAQHNAERLQVPRKRLQWRQGDWWEAAASGERFALVIANPPYIAESDPHLLAGDLRFEPRAALASGPDGLGALSIIIAGSAPRLAPGGWILLEHGWNQAASVRHLLGARGLVDVASLNDLAGHERVSLARAPACAPRAPLPSTGGRMV